MASREIYLSYRNVSVLSKAICPREIEGNDAATSRILDNVQSLSATLEVHVTLAKFWKMSRYAVGKILVVENNGFIQLLFLRVMWARCFLLILPQGNVCLHKEYLCQKQYESAKHKCHENLKWIWTSGGAQSERGICPRSHGALFRSGRARPRLPRPLFCRLIFRF